MYNLPPTLLKSRKENAMQFGYIPSFYEDLFNEVEFALEYFDYIEITLKEELELYSPFYISKIKNAIKNLPIMGHIHWNIDFSKGDPAETDKALKSVDIFRKLGARKITVHPSCGKDRNDENSFPKIIGNNIDALRKINAFCESLNIQLLLENKINPVFNRAEELLFLAKEIPGIKITLDTGHAELTSPTEGDNFLKLLSHVISHIHLHDTSNGYDHLFFEDSQKLYVWLDKLRNSGCSQTVTLEMFEKLKDNKPVRLKSEERNRLLLAQLNMAKIFLKSYL
jgi:sugar phosphate isomerase/epimerase